MYTGLTNHLSLSEKEDELTRGLSKIGRKAGLNSLFRADYGNIGQFD